MNTYLLLLFSFMALSQVNPNNVSNNVSTSLSISVSDSTQTLVIIGDSLTEGYGVKSEEAFPSKLQLMVQKNGMKWKILNHGISGSTSASAVSRSRWILKNPPQIAILALGANDGLRGIDPKTTEKNLDQAITLLQKAKVKVILAGMKMPPNYRGPYRTQFEKIFPNLAKKHHVKLIPFLLSGVGGVSNLNQKDGIHPNAAGHAVIAETVFQFIKSEL